MKKGFVAGRRPLIGLDGCHLSGQKKCILLFAIGLNGNNELYPTAINIVEGENKDSWTWFLQQLLMSIGPLEEHGWIFMSDRQTYTFFLFFFSLVYSFLLVDIRVGIPY